VEWAELIDGRAPLVRRLSGFVRSEPFSKGVSRQPGTFGYLVQRELVAEVHPPDFSQYFHADHPVFSCSKSEQKPLNTRVSFGSATTGQPPMSVHMNVVHERATCREALPWKYDYAGRELLSRSAHKKTKKLN
jgi:hypothetical protein